ncbi:hypothetical protein AVEN_84034-1 [Araneus ventricosus]|uniref:Uncharacterized protein n=1 Tax=Araneus ventricosus TaxID=182803 RepID=A0A4Y2NB44_ARAVE|nr:hypothetical protein AVEN_84034-1 [Araneus ventricosus]
MADIAITRKVNSRPDARVTAVTTCPGTFSVRDMMVRAAVAWWQGLGLGVGGLQVRNPIQLKIRRVLARCMLSHRQWVKHPPVDMARKFGEGVPAQVSSSDHGSK